jgi:hypothetical protein
MDSDAARILEKFAGEIAALAPGGATGALIERTQAALRAALTAAAGRPDQILWHRFYDEAQRLVAHAGEEAPLPGLRAFLAENADLRDEAAELVRS